MVQRRCEGPSMCCVSCISQYFVLCCCLAPFEMPVICILFRSCYSYPVSVVILKNVHAVY